MMDDLRNRVLYWALAEEDPAVVPVVIAIRGGRGWRTDLEAKLSKAAADHVVVVVEHVITRSAIDALRGRSAAVRVPAPVWVVKRIVGQAGWRVREAFMIWPALDCPRVAIPEFDLRMGSWTQRSGVLGGGRRVLSRVLLRSPIALPVTMMTAGATALVVGKSDQRRSS